MDESEQIFTLMQALYIIGPTFGSIVLFFLLKDIVSNFTAFIQIRTRTNFQYINHFEFDGRKNCRIFSIGPVKTIIQDLNKEQMIFIPNRQFLEARIWLNVEKMRNTN